MVESMQISQEKEEDFKGRVRGLFPFLKEDEIDAVVYLCKRRKTVPEVIQTISDIELFFKFIEYDPQVPKRTMKDASWAIDELQRLYHSYENPPFEYCWTPKPSLSYIFLDLAAKEIHSL